MGQGLAFSEAHTESLSGAGYKELIFHTISACQNATSLPVERAVQFPSWFLFTLETLTPF